MPRNKSVIIKDKQYEYEDFLMSLGDGEKSFKEAQCKHYVFYRNGRWSGGTRNSLLYSSNVFSPFFDNNFLKKATELDINILANEKLHYNIMKRLNPEFVKLPFYSSRWLFEEKGPINPNEYNYWLRRNPVYAKTKIGAYNWRSLNNEDNTLRNAFRNILLSNPSTGIFNIVDYNKIDSILSRPVPTNLNKFIWSLVSLKVYIDYYSNNQNYSFSKLRMKIPDSKIVNSNNHPVIRDLTPTLNPTNNALSINKDNKGTSIFLNKESKNHPYLQTGVGSFKTPPIKNKNILSVGNAKTIFVRFCIESVNINSDYKLFIMFYDENNRIYSESFLYTAKGKRTFLEKNIKLKENTKYVKFAIKFDSKNDNPNIKLKYGYMKLT